MLKATILLSDKTIYMTKGSVLEQGVLSAVCSIISRSPETNLVY